MKEYRYVGPDDIRSTAESSAPGAVIRSSTVLVEFLRSIHERILVNHLVPLTFVIDTQGDLRVADRNSEHISCAGGGDVLSAGELFVAVQSDGAVYIQEASNQSTGYCPEPDSWPDVAKALDRAGIAHPGWFTQEIVFRRCLVCNQRNLVKDGWFICALCDNALTVSYNCIQAS